MPLKEKKSITALPDADYQGKRVFLRSDFNVPMQDGHITSTNRIDAGLPSIRYLLERGARLIITTHLGRPKGEVDPQFSVKPIVEVLRQKLPGINIRLIELPLTPDRVAEINTTEPGSITMLENIRFAPGETKNDPEFSKLLASFTDIYVNDAFGSAHRAHASTEGIAHYVPIRLAGLLMAQELRSFAHILETPETPFVAIIGGSKVSTKFEVLKQLLKRVNNLIIGGGMVFTFLKAKGLPVGNSLVEDEFVDIAKDLVEKGGDADTTITLPKDVVIADRFAADAQHQVVSVNEIPAGWMGLDLGPESVERIKEIIQNSRTVFWNGPIGVFEFPEFAKGTQAVAEFIAEQTRAGHITSVLGGGDTEAAIEAFGIPHNSFTHVSTGGGASLELLEGKELPGVSVLEDKKLVTSPS